MQSAKGIVFLNTGTMWITDVIISCTVLEFFDPRRTPHIVWKILTKNYTVGE